jgi:hypothetical protein
MIYTVLRVGDRGLDEYYIPNSGPFRFILIQFSEFIIY